MSGGGRDRRRRRVASEDTAVDLLKYLEHSEVLYLYLAIFSAGKKREPTFFEIFRQGEEVVCIASWARWNAQLKGLAGVGKKVSEYEAGSALSE